jgi:SAM-dependent methyltransferase
VQPILSEPDNPMLPSGSIDAAILLKTYHEVADPVALLKNLRKSLRPGARLGVIDRNRNGEDHGIDRDVVIREAGEAGFKFLEEYDFVKADREDYFLVFELP